MVAKAGRLGWDEVEGELSRWKLLHIEWINNKVLLYSTEKYIQYLMINHNGKRIYFFNVKKKIAGFKGVRLWEYLKDFPNN